VITVQQQLPKRKNKQGFYQYNISGNTSRKETSFCNKIYPLGERYQEKY
jgi:hypothetical protein